VVSVGFPGAVSSFFAQAMEKNSMMGRSRFDIFVVVLYICVLIIDRLIMMEFNQGQRNFEREYEDIDSRSKR
jgi:hypothetical protein